MTAIIVALDDNKVIGNKGDIPWHLPGDLKLFKERTMGHPIIMGRKTWESLPKKPLPGRFNIVITRQKMEHEDVLFVDSMAKAIFEANKHSPKLEPYIIGGSEIYYLAFASGAVDRVVITKVPGEHEGDTYFPAIDRSWKCNWTEEHEGFTVLEYTRNVH